MTACDDWLDTEIKDPANLTISNKDEAYYARLREYKKSDHPVAFGWYGNWTGTGASYENSLKGLPDSVDFVSLWGNWKNPSPAMMEDLRYVQEKKGTKVLFCFLVLDIGDQITPPMPQEEINNGTSIEDWRHKFWGWDYSLENRLFGIDLMQNFKYPYFSRDIAEFWRRWHISLTTWFRDYIYIPLGGSRVGKWKSFRNTLVIFLVSGFWHGANWTFVAWGAYHALLFLPLLLLGQNRRYRDSVAENSFLPSVKELTQMGVTFLLVLLGWILFRSEDISQAAVYLERMFNASLFSAPQLVGLGFGQLLLKKCFFFTALMFIVEWIGRKQAHGLMIEDLSLPVRYVIYTVLLIIIYGFDASNPQGFIYFQF